MSPIVRFSAILFYAASAMCLAQRNQPIAVSSEFFKDPDFIKRFVRSYGALSEAEPPDLSPEENKLMTELAPMLQSDPAGAANRISQSLNDGTSAALIFTLANLQLQQGNHAEAEKSYKSAIKKFPDFRRAHKNLGLLCMQQGKTKEALASLKEALELGDVSSRTYGLMAHCYLADKQYFAAEAAYRQAFLLDPENKDWQMGLIRSLMAMNRFAEVNAVLEPMIEQTPDKTELWLLQINCQLGQNQQAEAATTFEILRLMDRATEEQLTTLGNLYIGREMFSPALSAYMAAMDNNAKPDAQKYLKTATILTSFGAHNLALDFVRKLRLVGGASLKREDKLAADTLEAKILRVTNQAETAAVILGKVLENDPLNGDALVQLGLHFGEKGDDDNFAKAKFYFERALKVTTVEFDANLRYAQMLVRRGKFNDALPMLRRAQELKRSDNLEQYLRRVERAARREAEAKTPASKA